MRQMYGGQDQTSTVTEIKESHLKRLHQDLQQGKHAGKTLIVMIYAPWCGHCSSMKPELEAAARETDENTIFVKIDGDAHPEVAKQLQVNGFPTSFVFQGSDPKKPPMRLEGMLHKEQIVKKIDESKQQMKGGGIRRTKQMFVPNRNR